MKDPLYLQHEEHLNRILRIYGTQCVFIRACALVRLSMILFFLQVLCLATMMTTHTVGQCLPTILPQRNIKMLR